MPINGLLMLKFSYSILIKRLAVIKFSIFFLVCRSHSLQRKCADNEAESCGQIQKVHKAETDGWYVRRGR